MFHSGIKNKKVKDIIYLGFHHLCSKILCIYISQKNHLQKEYFSEKGNPCKNKKMYKVSTDINTS